MSDIRPTLRWIHFLAVHTSYRSNSSNLYNYHTLSCSSPKDVAWISQQAASQNPSLGQPMKELITQTFLSSIVLHGHMIENNKDKRTKISSRSKKFNVRAADVDATSTQAHLSRGDLTMKLAILSLAVASAAAFTTSGSSRASTKLNGAMEDLKAVAEKSNPVLKVRVFF